MNDRDSAYSQADKILGDAMRLVTAGVDPDLASETVADALEALAKQAKALKNITYDSTKTKKVHCPECDTVLEVELPAFETLAKTMAQTAKMIDETARLTQFVSGKADSRPEVARLVAGLPVDVLKALTDLQLSQVMQWVEANGRESQDGTERHGAA